MSSQISEGNNTGVNDTGQAEALKVWSCVNCRRRKVRCDRRHPCAPCTKNKTECVFPVSGRIPRRSRDPNYPHAHSRKQAELLGRLRQLEAMVGNLGSQVEYAAVASKSNRLDGGSTSATRATSPTSSETSWPNHGPAQHSQSAKGDSPTAHDEGQNDSGMGTSASESPRIPEGSGQLEIANNGDIIVGDRFWTVFCKEVEQIFEVVHGPTSIHFHEDSSLTATSTSGNRRQNGFYNFLLSHTSATQRRTCVQPLPSQMLFLWQTYMDNVDLFMKILHVPTITKVIRELRGSYYSLSPSMHALVLVISLAAIMSLEDEEVRVNFNIEKGQLVSRYRLGTELALGQADFLNNPDIIALQALTIYLGVLQHTGETRSAWFLAGVLVRVAVSMKIHIDGSYLADITLFETEMRRRLWWLIGLIDARSKDAQVSAYKTSDGMFDTQMPLNTDDTNLDPGMLGSPVITEGWTDMTVFLIRCEVWKLSRRLQLATAASYALPSDINEKLELFQQSQARIEDDYLRHLNPSQPLHSFVATMTRLFLNKVDLILHSKQCISRATKPHPADAPQSDKVFMSSLSIIVYTYALQNEPSWSGWRWQIQGRQPPWHALHVVLSQLCMRQWGPLCDRAWSSAKRSLDNLPEAAWKDPRYQQLSEQASSMQRSRGDELHHQTSVLATDIHVDLAALTSSAPPPKVGTSETVSTWTPPGPSEVMADELNNNTFGDVLGLEIDWQNWDKIAGELEPSLDFWDMGGL